MTPGGQKHLLNHIVHVVRPAQQAMRQSSDALAVQANNPLEGWPLAEDEPLDQSVIVKLGQNPAPLATPHRAVPFYSIRRARTAISYTHLSNSSRAR